MLRINPFLLFAYDELVVSGGWGDYRGEYPTAIIAQDAAKNLLALGRCTHAHVVSLYSMGVVADYWPAGKDTMHESLAVANVN